MHAAGSAADAAPEEGAEAATARTPAADARSMWKRAGEKIRNRVRLVQSLSQKSVLGERTTARQHKVAQLVSEPSSQQGAAVRVMARLGVHGDTTGRDYEAPNVNLGAYPHKACRGRMSAAQLGRACAEIDATARRVIKAPWEDPALSAGGSSLFDPTLGGGGVFMKRGESRHFRPGDSVMCQHRSAGANTRWYGRLGYRGLGALETYRADLPASRLSGANGPWTLLPSTPSALRRREHLSRSVLGLVRTIPRQQSRDTWDKLTPDNIFGNYRRFESYSLIKYTDHAHRNEDASEGVDVVTGKNLSKLSIVKLNRMWDQLRTDSVGKVWYDMSLEVASWSQRRLDEDRRRARAVEKQKEENSRRIEGLMRRAEIEKEEAEAAVDRVNKERAEFEKAMAKLELEKQQLIELTAAAEADGAIDDTEAKQIQKETMDVQVAEARLKKEQEEFEVWQAKAQKEIQEYEDMKIRCDNEIERQKQWLHDAQAVAEGKALIQYNADFLQYSVLARMHTYQPRHGPPESEAEHMFENLNIVESQLASADDLLLQIATKTLQHACVYREDFVGYEGQWYKGRPEGYGCERHASLNLEYVGQFADDLWDGWGMLATFGIKAAYVGECLAQS